MTAKSRLATIAIETATSFSVLLYFRISRGSREGSTGEQLCRLLRVTRVTAIRGSAIIARIACVWAVNYLEDSVLPLRGA
jgi:hypothetical protein